MPRVNNRLVPDGIYFGIDNGSSGLRAAYVAVENGDASAEPVAVENNSRGPQFRLEAGDFDVMVPIDGDEEKPYHYGEDDRDPSRRYARLKYLIPVLALDDMQIKMADRLEARFPDGADEELAAELSLPPQCLPILALRKKMRLRWRTYLQEVAVATFKYLKRYLDAALLQSKIESHRRLPVRRYHLTIPDQWEGNPQRTVYERIFTKAFRVDHSKIRFCLESEAQHMYYHADESLRAKFRSTTPHASRCCFVLSNDFGGMSCNSALYTVFRNTDDGLHYCRVTDPVGTSGGSEEWEFHIAKLATKAILKKLKGVEVHSESLQDMLDQFNVEKKKMRPDKYGDKEYTYRIAVDRPNNLGGTDRTWESFQLSTARAIQQFEKSMKGPFENFENQLADAISRSKQSGFPLFVLIHGGMTQNKLFEDRLNKIATRLGLENIRTHLIFTASFPGSRHRSCHLAMGASQLAVDSQTFRDFVRDAAWGLQICQRHDNPSGLWNDVAAYIPFKKGHDFHHPGRKPQDFQDVRAGDGLKLVVDPLYNAKHTPSNEHVNCPTEYHDNRGDMLDPRSCCYDLHTFKSVPPEDVWFRLRLLAEEGLTPDTATLTVERSFWRWGTEPGRRGRYGPFQMWLKTTICYDSGSRLWLPEEGSQIVERKFRAAHVAEREQKEKSKPSKRKAKPIISLDGTPGPSTKRPRTVDLFRASSSESEEGLSPQQERPQEKERPQSMPWPIRFGPASRPPPKPSTSAPAPVGPKCTQQPAHQRGAPSFEFDGPEYTGYFSFSNVDQGS